jgi:hypothetical protein
MKRASRPECAWPSRDLPAYLDMIIEIERRLRRAEAAFAALRNASIDEYFLSMIYQHLCIVLSGNLEMCIAEILNEYARPRANPEIRRAIQRRLSGFQNPHCQRIIDLLNEFNAAWAQKFERFSFDEDLKDRIDSIAANRNQIAHGRSTGISASRISDFNAAHRKALEFIHALVLE